MNQGKIQSTKQRLFNISKDRKISYELVLNRYAVERFLYRVSKSSFVNSLCLKGASLLLVWVGNIIRATRDMDFMLHGNLEHDRIKNMIVEILEVETEDSLSYDVKHISVEDIREQGNYQGVRVKFSCFLGNVNIPCQLDLAVGDHVTPVQVIKNYPVLLDDPTPSIKVYPVETVIAEKFQIIVSLGIINSRLKDYFDLWFILKTVGFDEIQVVKAIKNTFARRQTKIPEEIPEGFSEEFYLNQDKIRQWKSFAERSGIVGDVPDLEKVVREIRKPLMKWSCQVTLRQ